MWGAVFVRRLFAAQAPRLDFETIVPIRAAAMQQLPQAGRCIGREEGDAPALVLADMHLLMPSQAVQLRTPDGDDDVAERDGAKGQDAGERRPGCLRLP